MILLATLAWLVALGQLAASLPFLIEVAAGLLPPRGRAAACSSVETAVLVPAHDEAPHLAGILAGIRAVVDPATRLLVVADNCTDDSAAVARAAGAEVIERTDPARRGKGYALAFGRDHLAAAPPQAVVVIDADCQPAPGAVGLLAGAAVALNCPTQAIYLMRPLPAAAAMVQISNFAFLVKNLVRQRGLLRLGLPAMLTGTGMAFPWRLFADADLATGNIVEDLALGIDMARAGHPARLVPGATVWSDPAAAAATLVQRGRWEGGYLATARLLGPPLVREGLFGPRRGLAWVGLHVMTPPLALLMMLNLAAFISVALLALLGAGAGALALSALVLAALGGVVLVAWALHGRPWLRAGTLLALPLYLVWKVPMYFRLLLRRGAAGWTRTARGG